MNETQRPAGSGDAGQPAAGTAPRPETPTPRQEQMPGEKGGPKGPEPTRYGDWEKGGRCCDF